MECLLCTHLCLSLIFLQNKVRGWIWRFHPLVAEPSSNPLCSLVVLFCVGCSLRWICIDWICFFFLRSSVASLFCVFCFLALRFFVIDYFAYCRPFVSFWVLHGCLLGLSLLGWLGLFLVFLVH